MHSFEIWLATTVIFLGLGTISFSLLEYRLGEKDLLKAFWINLKWIPFLLVFFFFFFSPSRVLTWSASCSFFFFGGLSIHLSVAILAHLFSYNIQWAATIKEVERSNFFKEVPKIFKRFWVALLICVILIAGMVILSTSLVPLAWRIDSSGWAVIFPLAVATGCHVLFPVRAAVLYLVAIQVLTSVRSQIVLNPYLMVFSY